METKELEIINYTERSIAVRGLKTKEFSQRLREEGGKFNMNLKDPVTGNKFSGWIFRKNEYDRIKNLLKILYDKFEENNSDVENEEVNIEDLKIEEFKYQEIQFKCIKPEVGMKTNIICGEKLIKGKIKTVKVKDDIVYQFSVKPFSNENFNTLINIGLIGKEWKMMNTNQENEIIFEI
jgi:hypothetical protein